MAKNSADLARKLYLYADGIDRANRQAVGQAAMFAKEQFIAGAVAAGLRRGGNLPSRGRAKWGARFEDLRKAAPGQVAALVKYVGPVHWAFWGTSPHIIAARKLATRRGARRRQAGLGAVAAFGGSNRGAFGRMGTRRGAKALTVPGASGPKAYAFHPGTAGRNTWPIVKNRVRNGAPKVFAPAHRGAMLRAGLGRP